MSDEINAADAEQIKVITYEWDDGLALHLTPGELASVQEFVSDRKGFEQCLRFLAELPEPNKETLLNPPERKPAKFGEYTQTEAAQLDYAHTELRRLQELNRWLKNRLEECQKQTVELTRVGSRVNIAAVGGAPLNVAEEPVYRQSDLKPKPIVLMQPYITDEMRSRVQETLHSRYVGQGPMVDVFEHRFGAYVKRPAVATGSGTDALHLAYILAGIRPGDVVLSPLFTCTATNMPLLWMGARIQFVDVEPGGLNMDPAHVARLVNQDFPIKAVVVVHYGGQRANVEAIRKELPLNVPIIEDCAQALGADVGAGPYACYSFQAVKHITTGDGGMLTLPQEQVELAKRLRWFGIDRKAKLDGTWANDITEVGYKYQMTDIAASMGLAGLNSMPEQMTHRRALANRYRGGLGRIPGIRVLDQDRGSANWLMTVAADRREDLMRKLKEEGIESGLVHYRNDRYKIFGEFRQPGRFPHMDQMESRYLVLPLHMGMDTEDVSRVCDVIRSGW